MKRLPRVLLPALLPLCGGCAALGGAAGALTGILQVALYLAMIAAPIALGWYLYQESK
jgi:hypothetical protein